MKKTISRLTAAALIVSTLSGCGKKASEKDMRPLMGLSWFDEYDSVKSKLGDRKLIREREKNGDVLQKMLDYANVELFGCDCDLTLCFTESGLVGLNYHDIKRNKTYRNWYRTLEEKYGASTESGNGMASWYDNPLGKDTAVYLFNLQEGVQLSFYASADAPDKSYEKEKKPYIPTPEIRTPVVPASANEDDPPETQASAENNEPQATDGRAGEDVYATEAPAAEYEDVPESGAAASEEPEEETSAAIAEPAAVITTTEPASKREEPATTTANAAPEPQTDKKKEFLINGLEFYGDADTERGKMSGYVQTDEYTIDEPDRPWELVVEYEKTRYLGNECDAILCFTSLGLVGINYFDREAGNYAYWKKRLTNIYGLPDDVQYNYSAWKSDQGGKGVEIYVFGLEDGAQISFFADDSGSD